MARPTLKNSLKDRWLRNNIGKKATGSQQLSNIEAEKKWQNVGTSAGEPLMKR